MVGEGSAVNFHVSKYRKYPRQQDSDQDGQTIRVLMGPTGVAAAVFVCFLKPYWGDAT